MSTLRRVVGYVLRFKGVLLLSVLFSSRTLPKVSYFVDKTWMVSTTPGLGFLLG